MFPAAASISLRSVHDGKMHSTKLFPRLEPNCDRTGPSAAASPGHLPIHEIERRME